MHTELPWSEMDRRGRAPLDTDAIGRTTLDALRRRRERSDHGRLLAQREVEIAQWTQCGAWVSGWCIPNHREDAVWRGPDSVGEDDAETARRVVGAVEAWESHLLTMGDAFDRIAEAIRGLDEVDAVAKAAAEVLPTVLEKTGAQGDWFKRFALELNWCLQACGQSSENLTERLEAAMGERFEDGVSPSPALAKEVCDDMALEVAVRERPPFTPDALEAWWTIRKTAPWGTPVPVDRRGVKGDAHRRFIEERDLARTKKQGDALIRALVRARWDAERNLTLDVERLKEWMTLATMKTEIKLRAGEAFGKDKAERYGRPKDLDKRLAQALADASAPGVSTISRAARIYLDLCFLHPFSDGNTRAARLALDYVLTRDGLALHDATPLFVVPRWGHDQREPWRFQRTLARLAGSA